MIDSSDAEDDGFPLLGTKLHIPAPRPVVVPRPRLVERLRRGVEDRLTLVAAPPGFGKTTLLAEWLASPGGRPAAGWLSLDPGDNDPAVFWAYLLAALRPVCADALGRPLALLHGRRQYPVETVLTALIDVIGSDGEEVVLVLDDYHLIETPSIHDGITFLLDHLPRRARLVIASRTDPPLPLARLRARGQLTELRAVDLRFTPEEAAALLGPGTSPGLTAGDVAVLTSRTEGWVAGLQLAALSIEGREDARGFVEAFSGVTRHIADYLVEEVLQRQPEGVRDFLLQTSILERMTGPLCDAVTEGKDGRRLLEQLERRNLFVVPLDDRREWYRYHHLFAEVLRRHLTEAAPEHVRALHGRASEWHRRHGAPADAVRHALAAGDTESAAELLERAWPAMDRANQSATWLGWVRAIPDGRVRASAALSTACAWALLYAGELAGAEAWLRDAERTLGAAERTEPECDRLRALSTSIATARAYRTQASGDVPGTIEHARRALGLMADDDHVARGPAAALLGLAYWTTGDLEAAHRTFGVGMDSLRAAGDPESAIGGSFVLGAIRVAQGGLRDAVRTQEHALRLAAEHTPPVFPGVGDLYLGLADQHRERGDLAAAARLLGSAGDAFEQVGSHFGSEHRWHVTAARLRVSEGDFAAALRLLDDAERTRVPTPLPDVRPAAALRARIWTRMGRLDEAVGWARDRQLSAGDAPEYLREYEHLALARLLLARPATAGHVAPAHEALTLLDRLEHAAVAGGRTGSLIEILIVRALAHQAHGETARALGDLERALGLAEPESYCRTFVDEGEPMRLLLRRAAASGIGGAYTRHLLAAFEPPRSVATAPTTPANVLAAPLTDRELQILRLIATGMRSREIAEQLSIRPATVKRHIANTYEKLEVGHRTAAVARAIRLQLL